MTLPFTSTVDAPCKLNLTLDVSPPRGDGFHDLDSLILRLSPSDELIVTVKPGARVVKLIVKDRRPDTVAAEPMPKGAANLAHQAALLMLDTFAPKEDLQVWVTLAKRLPLQAGLGAGSSNAAAVLKALGKALEVPLQALRPLAAQLGSDVSFFLEDAPLVRMQGRGELLQPVALELGPLQGILVRPGSGVPTGPAYALLDALPDRRPGEATKRLLAGQSLSEALSNDFEAVVLEAYPEVAAAHQLVQDAGAVRTLLCGSGSSVFGLAQDRAHARELVKKLAGKVAWIKQVTSL